MIIVALWNNDEDLEDYWPRRAAGKSFPGAPDHIAAAASEVHRCDAMGGTRSAALLARSVIEAVAKDHGIADGSLVHKISEMHQAGLIREYVKDGAHEVRLLGNDMAHGDFVNPIDESEVSLTIALMDEVLEETYVAPNRVQKARKARLQRTPSEQIVSC